MTDSKTTVGIVGAGSMGIMAGYDLTRAGAEVTFLVRPHRQEQLSRPQVLYSYADDTLEHYDGYTVINDPSALSDHPFDFLIVTLDGSALRAEAGLTLIREISQAYKGTETVVILGTISVAVRSWFIEQSGLADAQVLMGATGGFIHEVSAADLPLDRAISRELYQQADYAYMYPSPVGFTVDDSAPAAAAAFTKLHSAEGVPGAVIAPAGEFAVRVAAIAPILAWGLLGWRPLEDIDSADPVWKLGVESMREIQRLNIFGAAGVEAAERTDPAGVLAQFRQDATHFKPLDYTAFIAYQHGGKVNQQDLDFLDDARSHAASDGVDTPALDALITRLSRA